MPKRGQADEPQAPDAPAPEEPQTEPMPDEAASDGQDEPNTTKAGRLKQAWTDDATGKTYMPGEKLEAGDGV